MTNPKWKPPQQSENFIQALKVQAHHDMNLLNLVEAENTAIATSMRSLSSLEGAGVSCWKEKNKTKKAIPYIIRRVVSVCVYDHVKALSVLIETSSDWHGR